MTSTRRPWSKAQVRRVVDSIHVGGYSAFRSREGWNIWLSGQGAGPSRRRFFLPEESLRGRHPRWLSNRLIAALRASLEGLEGVRTIPGAEARELVRWCTRRAPRTASPPPTARQLARRATYQRWLDRYFVFPHTTHTAGYTAERSRRGWVVRLRSRSGQLPGHYLVPFRALGPDGRRWTGAPLMAALQRSLSAIEGAQRTNDHLHPSPTVTAKAA